ncbi:hypothetical protein KM043_002618 [Ampulex compressa]|nr:hypothetical protein KM043_002618 [Ampulex compressa]
MKLLPDSRTSERYTAWPRLKRNGLLRGDKGRKLERRREVGKVPWSTNAHARTQVIFQRCRVAGPALSGIARRARTASIIKSTGNSVNPGEKLKRCEHDYGP